MIRGLKPERHSNGVIPTLVLMIVAFPKQKVKTLSTPLVIMDRQYQVSTIAVL